MSVICLLFTIYYYKASSVLVNRLKPGYYNRLVIASSWLAGTRETVLRFAYFLTKQKICQWAWNNFETVLKLFHLFCFSFISHVQAAEMKLKWNCFISVLLQFYFNFRNGKKYAKYVNERWLWHWGRSLRFRQQNLCETPPVGEITMKLYLTCNKTSLSRKPCIPDTKLLWNAIRKSWSLFQNPSCNMAWSAPRRLTDDDVISGLQ